MPPGNVPHNESDWQPTASVAIQLQLRTDAGVMSFISTTTVFGTPMDITLAELAIESFFPADAATATALHGLLADCCVEPAPHGERQHVRDTVNT